VALQPYKKLPDLFLEFFDYKKLIGIVVLVAFAIIKIQLPGIIIFALFGYLAFQVFKTFNKIQYRANKIEFVDVNSLVLYFYNYDTFYKKSILREEFVFVISLIQKKNKSRKKNKATLRLGSRRDQVIIYDDYYDVLRYYIDLLNAFPTKKITQQEYVSLRNFEGSGDKKSDQLIDLILDKYENQN